MKELMKTNVYDVGESVLIVGSCLPDMEPEGFAQLCASSGHVFELVKAELAVVHDLAHGGNGVGRDLHKVELLLLCLGQRLLCGDDAEHGAVRCDQADLLIPDLLIELMI